MVYYRSFWNYYIVSGLIRGIIMGDLKKYKSINNILQNYTDGATARYCKIPEWKETVKDLFKINYVRVMGMKSEPFPFPAGKFKDRFLNLIPDSFSRLLTNNIRMGCSLLHL